MYLLFDYSPEGRVLKGIISAHVDDVFAAGDESELYNKASESLLASFPFGEWRCLYDSSARFCGSEVT